MKKSPAAFWACVLLSGAAQGRDGVRLVGRWLTPDTAPVATYAGSLVLLGFRNSATVAADLNVSDTKLGQGLFVSVSVDGGKPVRMELNRGTHAAVVLASGLSRGSHVVAIRKEGEPRFGALHFANPTLAPGGVWQTPPAGRPIVEVIGDSDATGICALGPDSPAIPVSINASNWAAQSLSWVGVLDADLAGAGHPVDMVDLAISGSTTRSEAASYDYTAPDFSDAKFAAYATPGRTHASLVLMWGGGNDRHSGGDLASAAPPAADNLSAFQKGVFDQLTKIFARNPDVRVVLLQYIDSTIPDWQPAYAQVRGLFSEEQQRRILFLAVHDPKGDSDACEIDPKGHPNAAMHVTWATQILTWMLSSDVLPKLGLDVEPQWHDE